MWGSRLSLRLGRTIGEYNFIVILDHLRHFPSPPRTGWLRKPEPEIWAEALEEILALTAEGRKAISLAAKERAEKLFGMGAMAKWLETVLKDAVEMGPVSSDEVWGVWWKLIILLIGFLAAYAYSSK